MAEKFLRSLNFGDEDTYFPLPPVTIEDNEKVLMVINGEWEIITIIDSQEEEY